MNDFIFAGTDEFNKSVIDPIARRSKIEKRSIENFCYVRLNVSQNKSNTIQVNQNEYAAEMKGIPISASRKNKRKFHVPVLQLA